MVLRAEQLTLLKRKATTANKFQGSVFRACVMMMMIILKLKMMASYRQEQESAKNFLIIKLTRCTNFSYLFLE
jgi:hypothetical protein